MFLALREIVVNVFSPLTLSQFSEQLSFVQNAELRWNRIWSNLFYLFYFNSLVRHSYTKHIVVSLPPLIYCMWSSFSECFFCMFVLSHLCLTGSQGIRWSWSWRGSRRLQSLCPASLGRRTSTWDRTFLEAKRFCPLFTVYKIKLDICGSLILFIITLRWPPPAGYISWMRMGK